MDLRVLRYFVAVADTGTVTGAAAQVHVAQPSLSRQLRQLQRELAIDLFRRDGGRLTLTRAGMDFLPIARELVVRADQARAAARAISDGSVRLLRLAAPAVTISDVIAPYLARGEPDDPLMDVWEETAASALDPLNRGADLVVLSATPNPELSWQPVARLPMFAYAPPGHPWCTKRVITIEELVTEPLAVLSAHHGTRRTFDEAVSAAGLTYRSVVECESPQVAQALTAAGRAVSVVSDDSRFDLDPLLIEAQAGILRIPLHAAWLRGHFATETIRRFIGRLTMYCAERYGSQALPRTDTVHS